MNEYCKVVYLDRTDGISSSDIRKERRQIKLGLVGDSTFLNNVFAESQYVNGIHVTAVYTSTAERMNEPLKELIVKDYDKLLENVDAVYIRSLPELHYQQIKKALTMGKSLLCESPLTLNEEETVELFSLAESKKLILMEAIKTAYATAFSRLLLLVKGGKIGKIVSVDTTCTSLRKDISSFLILKKNCSFTKIIS